VQLVDLIYTGQVQLFLAFFCLTWSVYLIKLARSSVFRGSPMEPRDEGVSVIVPVVDEDAAVWDDVLARLRRGCADLPHQILVVANGDRGEANAEAARLAGFEVVHLRRANKRDAIAEGARRARYPIAVVLDSDTRVEPEAIRRLRDSFVAPEIGGVTPLQRIYNRRALVRRVADWLEDMRFHVVVRGQSVGGAVSCLPGRLYAIRTELLQAAVDDLVRDQFLGMPCVIGDDRFLTSWLLEHGHRTIYQPRSLVYTEAPDSVAGFARQQLRWARGDLRYTLKSLPWTLRYPYLTFANATDVLVRWLFFAVILHSILVWSGMISMPHVIRQFVPVLDRPGVNAIGVVLGFLASGLIWQTVHLARRPGDLAFFPIFLLLTTVVLTPVKWYGDLTCWRNDWMTRRVGSRLEGGEATEAAAPTAELVAGPAQPSLPAEPTLLEDGGATGRRLAPSRQRPLRLPLQQL
jgi:hyaluronan synthase